MCVKGANVPWHQHHADRLTHPLKKTDGGFVRISWEQAIAEISEKLTSIVKQSRPALLRVHGRRRPGMPLRGGLRHDPHEKPRLALSLQRARAGADRLLLGVRKDARQPEPLRDPRRAPFGHDRGHRVERDGKPPDAARTPRAPGIRLKSRQATGRHRSEEIGDGEDRKRAHRTEARDRRPSRQGDDRHHPEGGMGEKGLPRTAPASASRKSRAGLHPSISIPPCRSAKWATKRCMPCAGRWPRGAGASTPTWAPS